MSSLFTNDIFLVFNKISFRIFVNPRYFFNLIFRCFGLNFGKVIVHHVFFQILPTAHYQVLVTFIFKSEIIETNRPLGVAVEYLHKFLFFIIVVLSQNLHAVFNCLYKLWLKLIDSLLMLFHYVLKILVKSIKKIKLV